MYKTNKSVLAKKLRSFDEFAALIQADIDLIDGFYFLYQMGSSISLTFEKIGQQILRKLCTTSARCIHVIFDRYFSPSIKDHERCLRGEIKVPYSITGPSQTRPADFLKAMKNYKFQEALIQFIFDYWNNDNIASIIQQKKIFLTVNEKCYSYESVNDKIIRTELPEFQCNHEEADTRIVYHLSKLPINSKVMVKTADTDIMIIILGNIHMFPTLSIYVTTIGSKPNSIICTNCSKLSIILGEKVCRALPGQIILPAFTKRVNQNRLISFCLDPSDIDNIEKMSTIQKYTSHIYGVNNCNSVNTARLLLFQKSFAIKSTNDNFMNTIKNFDSSLIPPCWKSLKQKIQRTIYVNSMWENATDADCIKFSAHESGWQLIDGKFVPLWFEGDSTPVFVEDVLLNDENVDDDIESNFLSDDYDEN